MSTFWAPGPAETSIEDPAIQESIDRILYDLSKVAKGWLKPLFINLKKGLKIVCQGAVEDGFFRLTAAVDLARSWVRALHPSEGRKKLEKRSPPTGAQRRHVWIGLVGVGAMRKRSHSPSSTVASAAGFGSGECKRRSFL